MSNFIGPLVGPKLQISVVPFQNLKKILHGKEKTQGFATKSLFGIVNVLFVENAVVIIESQKSKNLTRNGLRFELGVYRSHDFCGHRQFSQRGVRSFARRIMIVSFIFKH